MNAWIARVAGGAALAFFSVHAGAAGAPVDAASHPGSASAAMASKHGAEHETKMERGAALDKCKGMQGDEKKHCQAQARRAARAALKEETGSASSPRK